jgi:hypothetical protein
MHADVFRPLSPLAAPELSNPGELCGMPADAEYFDESGITAVPEPGREATIARFSLAPRYCGRFENFCQFTDLQARDHAEIETPGLQWLVLINHRPLYPYLNLERIINPWGWGSFPVSIRLDESAVVEFVVRNAGYTPPAGAPFIRRIGGRILGRYWFNPTYGHARHARS